MAIGMGSKLILAFTMLIIGIVLITPLATQGNAVTDKKGITDESISIASAVLNPKDINSSVNFTVANVPATWKTEDCPLSSVVVTNGSGTTLTSATDYILTASEGRIAFLNTTETQNIATSDNSTLVDYVYCGDDYVNVSWGRTSIDVVMGLFAIAVLGVSLFLFFDLARDAGLIARS